MSKIPVSILGATGIVGQRFIQMLYDHPLFKIAGLVGSTRNIGTAYKDSVNWVIEGDPPDSVQDMPLLPLNTKIPGRLAFSALPTKVAQMVEPELAEAGFVVCSNASAFRLVPDVPMIIPEVNADHLKLLAEQKKNRQWKGLIITSPNCTTTGMVMPLKPLHEIGEIRQILVVTFQAISGAGYPGASFLDASDNLIPFIPGEEEKITNEAKALFGIMDKGRRKDAEISLSVQANRGPILHGHTLFLSVSFKNKLTPQRAIEAIEQYRGSDICRHLPSAPAQPITVRHEIDRPQPRRDRDANNGMMVTVGRIRECPLLDLRMVSVVHNAIRGAAGGSILNAELLVAERFIE